MAASPLRDLAMEFSLEVIQACGAVAGHRSLVDQLERSATSIGANLYEAQYAHSKADFIAKMQISLKECYESEYWLELFRRANLLPEEKAAGLFQRCGKLRRMLVASINTAKRHQA